MLNKNAEKRFLIAKSPWIARKVLNKIRQGKIGADQVLFLSNHAAVKRIQRMPRNVRSDYNIYQTDFIPPES